MVAEKSPSFEQHRARQRSLEIVASLGSVFLSLIASSSVLLTGGAGRLETLILAAAFLGLALMTLVVVWLKRRRDGVSRLKKRLVEAYLEALSASTLNPSREGEAHERGAAN